MAGKDEMLYFSSKGLTYSLAGERSRYVLRQEFGEFGAVKQAVSEAMGQVQSTHESALNFHEALNSLVSE